MFDVTIQYFRIGNSPPIYDFEPLVNTVVHFLIVFELVIIKNHDPALCH